LEKKNVQKFITSSDAPKPIGPYSQAIIAGGLMFVSGQVAIDPKTGNLVEGGISEQTEQVLKNLLAILKEAKLGAEHIVKATVYLADMAEFAAMNEVYARHLGQHPPARSTIQAAALPKAGARVEIDLIAAF
jgi:2-iminobutanoate/2-iminopropanoate deaminase